MNLSPREAYYRARVQPCRLDALRLRDNIAFAILSSHCPMRETDVLFGAWRDAGRPADAVAIGDAWADTRAQYQPTKAAYISSLMAVPDAWIVAHARDRVALETLRGLGRIKASFAAALNGANVACLDRHMVRALRARKYAALRAQGLSAGKADSRLAPANWKAYRALEQVLAARTGNPDLFVSQWATWNVIRESNETHEILWDCPKEETPF